MKKIKLEMESLVVESFTTATDESGRGTVVGHEPTQGHNQQCGSAYDACNTGLCTPQCEPTFSPEACPTQYPEYC